MKRLVIIGGGFAGTKIARTLEDEFGVTLIDSKDYFEFTPGILRTIVEPEHIHKIRKKHKEYLKKTKVITGKVHEISNDSVVVNKKKIKFDYLAICSGSKYSSPIKEHHLFYASRAESLKRAHENLKDAKNILIIGGGPVGVELAGEICTYFKDKKICLVHSWDRLTPRNKEKTSKYIQKFLEKKGVEFILGDSVNDKKGAFYLTENGKKIKCDLCFLTKGAVPNFEFAKKNFSHALNKEGQIIVDAFLRLEGKENIFVAGDVNSVKEEKTAQNAENNAKIIIKNLRALEGGRVLRKYGKEKNKGMVISLGKRNGVYERGNFVLKGFIPAIMKGAIERAVMRRYR